MPSPLDWDVRNVGLVCFCMTAQVKDPEAAETLPTHGERSSVVRASESISEDPGFDPLTSQWVV